ncbi:NAD(P)-binding protein [Mollisia scopiformis]|uniref:NAD(P)-binding protein n=1 Tax=Mollisia scopiformis TaxID=149040 RepID=A0A194X2J3_MOLSC|nr:NAD(P)-binding protein [Mollisia scopiformis]KUJ14229.1 NAD(P)-binding protein [Mollisia scopiformis]
MSPTTYLITGASRGLGLGLLKAYLSRPNTTVIAAVRNPTSASSLNTLPKGEGSTLIIVKIDSASHTDALAAVKELTTVHNINTLDVVIANAGISNTLAPVAIVPLSEIEEHFNVNAIGPFLLFQACFPLLKKGSKFIGMSSALATISGMEMRPFPMTAYGVSKAALNYFVRKIHFENEELISFALDPGFVQTDMGNTGAQLVGMKEATTPIDDCVAGMLKIIDESTREKTSGRFPIWEGGEFPW